METRMGTTRTPVTMRMPAMTAPATRTAVTTAPETRTAQAVLTTAPTDRATAPVAQTRDPVVTLTAVTCPALERARVRR